uniref:RING-type domain-containing protein n=1 Tax=Seriola dumerili TaxID=41447 RepID=A0A3B4UTL7_SERDU
MASAPASSSETCSLDEHLTCSICMEMFEDPVTTDCGHSFCKKCLDLCHEYAHLCPMCKKPLSRIPDVNIVLRDIVQQQKVEKIKEEDDDIYTGEDIYTDQTQRGRRRCNTLGRGRQSTRRETG